MKNILIGIFSLGTLGILAGPGGVLIGVILGGLIGNSINKN